ncbi:DUF6065 family protein [Methylocella sp. CPCC 101449]|uniref:DUF6065 family protein n=1 Tax=Methylocella sp. CPCC 101449 TaxID=2987531 RepID=UPI002892621F|nr:DUF6065 family protein [Methylocella sp. CPCC 101449]MDT2021213.1 DUF6065 family protein [Methylocella sp. CPCC 101449]
MPQSDRPDEGDTSPPLKLECYAIHDPAPKLVPGVSERDWMDYTNQHFAYRCTPLTIANTSGWELLNPSGFSATWTGYNGESDIILRPDDRGDELRQVSLGFGHGILTFHVGYLFRTDPGWMLWARGAPNRLKHGIQALDGLVETDWLPFTFTMNWKFTEPGTIHFERDEPFCFITPMPALPIETIQPVISRLDENRELHWEYKNWLSERSKFNFALRAGDPVALEQKWQKNYFFGKSPTGQSVANSNHRVKRSLKAPISRSEQKLNKHVQFKDD